MGAYLQAEVATENGDRTEALKALEEAVRIRSAQRRAARQLATLYVRDGRLKDALKQADKAMQLDPGHRGRAAAAAGISSALGDDDTAEQQYHEVMRLAPKNQEAYLFLGTLYAKQGDYTKAEGIFKQLIALDTTSFLGYYYAGRGDGGGAKISRRRYLLSKGAGAESAVASSFCWIWRCCASCRIVPRTRSRSTKDSPDRPQ